MLKYGLNPELVGKHSCPVRIVGVLWLDYQRGQLVSYGNELTYENLQTMKFHAFLQWWRSVVNLGGPGHFFLPSILSPLPSRGLSRGSGLLTRCQTF